MLEVETKVDCVLKVDANGNHTSWCGKEIRELSCDTKAAFDALASFVASRDALMNRVKKDWFVYGALAKEVLHLLIAPFDPNGAPDVPDLTLRDLYDRPGKRHHSGEATILTQIMQLFCGFRDRLDTEDSVLYGRLL